MANIVDILIDIFLISNGIILKTYTSKSRLIAHLVRNAIIGCLFIAIALFIGMLGYHVFEDMPWVDAFANASMILSGMGPLKTLTTTSGKIFAGCYALFSGLVFIVIVALMLSPIVHKFLIRIHLEGTRIHLERNPSSEKKKSPQ